MANVFEPSKKHLRAWQKWLATRPAAIQALSARFQPWGLYRLKTTGQIVCVRSFNEDGTVKVLVVGRYNFFPLDYEVFGIDPDDLEPCDVPDETVQ